LADTFEALAAEGADLFYRGDLARRLAEQCREGGALSLEDLASYRVIQRAPFEFSYRGHRLLTNPPPSCGGILIAFSCSLLENLEGPFHFGSTEDLAELAQAMEWTNKARMDVLSQAPDWIQASERLFEEKFLREYREKISGRPSALRGTTHINVIDGQGNLASMSLSNGEGCGRILKGTGIMLNNMLGEEDINPSGFFNWKPDQRMTSMMAPTLLFAPDQAVIAMGSGGSNRIRTAILQVLRNLIDHGMSVPEAVAAPRIHFERGLLSVEPGFSDTVVHELKRTFSRHHLWENKNLFFGGVHTAGSHPLRGFSGAGDPRRFGVCLQV
jgi:gamma-glutamyltranspeptidase/glutathione hydrolase